jgi:hypothetical protein
MSLKRTNGVANEDHSRNRMSYAEDWNVYRHLIRRFVSIWLFYIPVVGSVAWVCQRFFHTFVPAFVVALAWMLWFALAAAEIGQFSCPRCGAYFAGGPGIWCVKWWVFARRCSHCGLRKFANSPNAESASTNNR